ncbi:MAG: hypothetical protein NTW87_09985 [Planctomycetota bacterium]|nr:hypothetical protein [Planctomycetota bacterium]
MRTFSLLPALRQCVLTLGLLLAVQAAAEVYQYAVEAKDSEGKNITAFLWVPPEAGRIKGVLVGGLTLMEPAFAGDPLIRQACVDEKLAVVYFAPALDAVFNYKEKNSGELLQKALDDLAQLSGYREIAVAPLFPFGHSVSTLFASHAVCWNPGRCFGALLFKGGISFPANDPGASMLGVPILAVKGQFEEFGPGPSGVLRDFEDREAAWKGMRDRLLALRGKDDHHLVSLLVEAGASHFAWSERVSTYVALFIRKAAQRRIPDWPADSKGPPKLNEIDPASGALSSGDIGQAGEQAANYKAFKGSPAKSMWHLDLELAAAHDAFHKGAFSKKPQFVTFADPKSGKAIFVGHDLRLKLGVNWSEADTFKVAGTFLDQAPDKYPKVDGPVGHADGPVLFRAYGGTVEQTGADTFRVRLDGRQKVRAEILAYHTGNPTYRYAEQQGRAVLPERLTQGKPQAIKFPETGPLRPDSPPVKLLATSDSGLKVRFYVEYGPAMIEEDTLKITEMPTRAVLPLKIKVVAYQYGSAVEPLVQSAEAVKQEILVVK